MQYNENDLIRRAQQFQSFDALKEFRELLKQQEYQKVSQITLSEEDKNLLDYQVNHIKIGMMLTVTYCEHHSYRQITGLVTRINKDLHLLQIVKTKINLLDIVHIEGISINPFE